MKITRTLFDRLDWVLATELDPIARVNTPAGPVYLGAAEADGALVHAPRPDLSWCEKYPDDEGAIFLFAEYTKLFPLLDALPVIGLL